MSLFFGLGNPGARFVGTRHNVGYDVVATVAQRMGLRLKKPFFGRYEAAGIDPLLARPLTYMNRAGEVLPQLFKKTHLGGDFEPSSLVVICDTLDLTLGRIRVRQGGGTAGHNGIKSIVATLGHGDFARIYIGIGRPPTEENRLEERNELEAGSRRGTPEQDEKKDAVRRYVLEPFDAEQRPLADKVLTLAADALSDFTTIPIEQIMSRYNGRDLADE